MKREHWIAVLVLLIGLGLLIQKDAPTDSVRDRMVDAVDGVNSYRFTNEIAITTEGTLEGNLVNYVQNIKGDGAIDIASRRMSMNIEIFNLNKTEKMDVYFIGNTAYVSTKEGVSRQEVPLDDAWETKTQIKQQSGLLKEAEVEVLREDVMDGREVYVLRAKPEIEKLIRYMAQQSVSMPVISDDELDKRIKMVKSIEILQWVDKKTFLPVRFEINVVMDTGDLRRETDIVMTIGNYNEQFTIELPESALV